ncbi:MAG: hypothetical protein Q7U10_09175 [Thermodesulfovibrionia bacterium]|nr:hypothetical protein [Thermodesulfovibrionia bacterium]
MKTISKKQLFGQFDFRRLDKDPDFKEDSVREVIVLPILTVRYYVEILDRGN